MSFKGSPGLARITTVARAKTPPLLARPERSWRHYGAGRGGGSGRASAGVIESQPREAVEEAEGLRTDSGRARE